MKHTTSEGKEKSVYFSKKDCLEWTVCKIRRPLTWTTSTVQIQKFVFYYCNPFEIQQYA